MNRQDTEHQTSMYDMDQTFWIGKEKSLMAHTLFLSSDTRCPVSKHLRGDTHTNMHCPLGAYLHTWIGPHSPPWHMHGLLQWKLRQTPNTLCRAAVEVNAGVTRHVSHSIPLTRTGDSPRGQKWAKDRNLIPNWKSSGPASVANVIHSSCDTAAMCWGLFLRNGRVELESSWILLASVWTKNWRVQMTWWGGAGCLCVLKSRFR